MAQIKIEKIAYGAKGIARLNGKVFFIENALPGETVEVEIIKEKKNFVEARATQIASPSPHREKPPCIYYNTCGGCQYQHMSYAEELKWKETQIREHLQKQLSIDDSLFLPIIANSNPYEYRNHITLHSTPTGWGFVDEDNESTTTIEKCLIAQKELNAWMNTTNGNAPQHEKQNRITVRLGAGGKVITSQEDIFFNVPIGSTRIRTHSRCFFQNNLEMTVKIAEKIHTLYEQTSPAHFWDLYSGVGTFTALVHPRKSQIICVESHPKGIEALEMNLKNLGLAAEIAPEPVENCLEDILDDPRSGSVLAVLDPPKAGLDPRALKALISGKGPDILAYISCHMGALARDLKGLAEKAYGIESIQAFDMFPRTKHIETLVILKKK